MRIPPGKATLVVRQAVDARPDKDVYIKKGGFATIDQKYPSLNDPAEALQKSLVDSMRAAGYEVMPDMAKAPWQLEVKLVKWMVEEGPDTIESEAIAEVRLAGPDGSLRSRRFVGHGSQPFGFWTMEDRNVVVAKSMAFGFAHLVKETLAGVTQVIR